MLSLLEQQGYTRVFGSVPMPTGSTSRRPTIARSRPRTATRKSAGPGRRRSRAQSALLEALERALVSGQRAPSQGDDAGSWKHCRLLLQDLHCADCDIHYREPPRRACSRSTRRRRCESCRGFGRIIGIDFGLIVPDESKSLKGGASGPGRPSRYRECQDDLIRYARKSGMPHRRAVARADREQQRSGCSKARAAGKTSSGTACAAFSPGSKPSPTRCTFACCCRSTAPTRRARRATARG